MTALYQTWPRRSFIHRFRHPWTEPPLCARHLAGSEGQGAERDPRGPAIVSFLDSGEETETGKWQLQTSIIVVKEVPEEA